MRGLSLTTRPDEEPNCFIVKGIDAKLLSFLDASFLPLVCKSFSYRKGIGLWVLYSMAYVMTTVSFCQALKRSNVKLERIGENVLPDPPLSHTSLVFFECCVIILVVYYLLFILL